jgi:uncharacterized membrane protein YjgN (DUF898 family)
MTAAVTVMHQPKKMARKSAIKMWVILALVAMFSVMALAPVSAFAQEASCTNGVDQNGDPCLDIKAEMLMTQIFRWANIIIPVLLPLVAIGIGIQFGGNILSSIKNFFGSFRLG